MAMTVESITKSIENYRVKVNDYQRKIRELEAKRIELEYSEIQKVIKAIDLPNKTVTILLKAYAAGIIDLPDDIKEELEAQNEE